MIWFWSNFSKAEVITLNLGYGCIGTRNDITQQSGETPDKEVELKNITVMLAATLKPIRLECYLPRLSGANKVSLFGAKQSGQILAAVRIGFECRWNG